VKGYAVENGHPARGIYYAVENGHPVLGDFIIKDRRNKEAPSFADSTRLALPS
jgi:hypothetical protein